MKIIGCGNRARGDDAAGVLVVERLRNLGIEGSRANTVTCSGETAALMDLWDADDDLIIIDAVVTGARVGTIHLWHELPPLGNKGSVSTHGLGIAEAINLTRALGRFPKSLRVYGIEGRQFEPGAPVSCEVQESAGNLARKIGLEIQAVNSK